VHRAGVTTTHEPALCRLPGFARGAGTSALGSTPGRGSGGHPPSPARGITIAVISVFHPVSLNTLLAATSTAFAAAARRDQQIEQLLHEWDQMAYPFVPFSVESDGRSGQPAMKLLH
jgi:hypothetical protein